MCTEPAGAGDVRAAMPHPAAGSAADPIALEPVDDVVVTTLVNNVYDALLTSDDTITRAPLAAGTAQAPQFEPGRTSTELMAEHGFSALVTVRRGDTTTSVLFDTGLSPDAITGEVDRTTDFEHGMPPAHQHWTGTTWEPDPLILNDQALVANVRGKGLVIVTGCGHAGAVNIVRHAQRLTGVPRLARQDGPAIVAGHSYGGQIITALGTDAPNVAGLVYIAAFGLDEGESVGALLGQGPPSPALAHLIIDEQGFAWLPEEDFVGHFAADVDPVRARVMAMVSHPQDVLALIQTAAQAVQA